jgi:hypothetical protein
MVGEGWGSDLVGRKTAGRSTTRGSRAHIMHPAYGPTNLYNRVQVSSTPARSAAEGAEKSTAHLYACRRNPYLASHIFEQRMRYDCGKPTRSLTELVVVLRPVRP